MMRLPEIRMLKILFALLLLVISVTGRAAIETYRFDDASQEESYKKLVAELRCLVCQNQNLADSNAELAHDMRRKTYELIIAGKTDDEIVDFMVARYGDFVMYNPPVKSTTMLLWFGPLVFLLIAASVVFVFMRKQKKNAPVVSAQQQKQVHKLLDE
ncbi:MAG: cytochrome c-type biosis protein CcmH [Pseudomonadota bacterium]|nr:cytochrome c-type biosis protein CcmH [Pseudomonadota bacterium]